MITQNRTESRTAIATAVLQGIITRENINIHNVGNPVFLAKLAVSYADALLVELENEPAS